MLPITWMSVYMGHHSGEVRTGFRGSRTRLQCRLRLNVLPAGAGWHWTPTLPSERSLCEHISGKEKGALGDHATYLRIPRPLGTC